jgi:hypothetical protein
MQDLQGPRLRDEGAGKPSQEKSSQEDGSAVLPQRNTVAVAPQPNPESSDNDQLIAKRLHGRALPK